MMKRSNLIALSTLSLATSAIAEKPNIVFILTDDQGYGDLACHGHPFLKTPNLDKMYAESTRFTDFHASPTCAPTRAALMSGMQPIKVGVTHTILERELMNLKNITIAQVLKKAGYSTGIFGKWHLGDEDEYQPFSRGFDECFTHAAGGIGQNFPGSQGDAPGTSYFAPIIRHNKKFVQTDDFCTNVFFRQALTWMKERKETGKPFFSYISLNAPHAPYLSLKEHSDLYKDKFKSGAKSKGKKKSKGKSGGFAEFYGMITNIDENVGLLMSKLDEWKILDDTLVIFMTDNGSAKGTTIYNAGMRGRKSEPYQGGTRVPLFLRWPKKFKAGLDIDRLTRHYDLFPTLAELAGAEVPSGLDGRSLLPLTQNPKAEWEDRYHFIHKTRWKKEPTKYEQFTVRNEKWRLVNGKELYDVDADIGETNNLAKQYPEVVKQMMNAFEKFWDEATPLMINEGRSTKVRKPYVEEFKKQKASIGIPKWDPAEL